MNNFYAALPKENENLLKGNYSENEKWDFERTEENGLQKSYLGIEKSNASGSEDSELFTIGFTDADTFNTWRDLYYIDDLA